MLLGVSQLTPWWRTHLANSRDTRDEASIPGLGRSPGGGRGNSLQYSCLGNNMDRGAWQATVRKERVGCHWAMEHTHTHTHTHTHCINYLLLYSKLSQSLSAWSISKHYLMKFLQAKNRSSLMVWFWLGVSREGDTKLSARAAVLWGLNGLWKTHLQGG